LVSQTRQLCQYSVVLVVYMMITL